MGTREGGAETQLTLPALVHRALEDRTLRQQALTAGLAPEDLLENLANDPPKLEDAALDERAEIEETERNLQEASESLSVQMQRIRRMRRLGWVGVILLLALISASMALLILDEAWLQLGIAALALGPFVALSIGGMLDWPPYWIARQRYRDESAIRSARSQLEISTRNLRDVLVETEVKPLLRTYLNSRRADQYRTTLTLVEQEGLAELEDPRYAIPTHSRKELDRFLQDMPGGSIGLSGPRGAGKTTLIRAICPTKAGGTKNRLGVVVAAPVKFDSREFLLHLFAEVCRAVLGPSAVADLREPDPVGRVISQPGSGLLLSLATLIAPLVGAILILDAVTPWQPLPQVVLGGALVVGGVFAGWLASSGRRIRAVIRRRFFGSLLIRPGALSLEEAPTDLQRAATKHLQDIWYQQAFTTGWSGSLKVPVAEAGMEGSRELARNQMTLPDIVGDFRRLLAEVAEKRRVFIGIDELDKLESHRDAYTFMNEMKVLFGLDRCFFLVSVSEDAMSVFERRGLPFRDVFDSSFDDVVNVGFLDVDESVALLQRRLVGMPLPFIFLCHCIAGGLPRDVIRVAREVIVSNPATDQGWPIHEAARKVVEADVRAKVSASLVATRGMPLSPDVERLRTWLQQLRSAAVTPGGLLEICSGGGLEVVGALSDPKPEADPATSPRALGSQLLSFLLYSSTLLELFDERRTSADYRVAHDEGRIEQLAHARQALSLHPRAAWESLEALRGDGKTPGYPEEEVAGAAHYERWLSRDGAL